MRKFPFTKKAIEALPPHDPDSPSREAEYSDSECIGLKPLPTESDTWAKKSFLVSWKRTSSICPSPRTERVALLSSTQKPRKYYSNC